MPGRNGTVATRGPSRVLTVVVTVLVLAGLMGASPAALGAESTIDVSLSMVADNDIETLPGSVVTVSGSIAPMLPAEFLPASVTIQVTPPDAAEGTTVVVATDGSGNFAHEILVSDWDYTYVTATFNPDGRHVALDAAELVIPVARPNGPVIVVAGGANHTESATFESLADLAVKTLRRVGTTDIADSSRLNRIQYLHPDPARDIDSDGASDVDGPASVAALEHAITQWAPTAVMDGARGANGEIPPGTHHGFVQDVPLTVYLVGDYDPFTGEFVLDVDDPDQRLTSFDMAGWLDEFEANVKSLIVAAGIEAPASVPINLIVDSPSSGSFICTSTDNSDCQDNPDFAPISAGNPHRVILTSTDTDAPNYMLSSGSVSFSNYFLSRIAGGQYIHPSFAYAQLNILGNPAMNAQKPQIEATGNGVSNEIADEIRTASMSLEYRAQSNVRPRLQNAFGQITLKDVPAAQLWVYVKDPEANIVRVEALVLPPVGSTESPTIVPMQAGSIPDRWEGVFGGFHSEGMYTIVYLATDESGNQATPITKTVVFSKSTPPLPVTNPEADGTGDGAVRLSWTPSDSRDIRYHTIDVTTPSGASISLGNVGNVYQVDVDLDTLGDAFGIYEFDIRAVNSAGLAAEPASATYEYTHRAPDDHIVNPDPTATGGLFGASLGVAGDVLAVGEPGAEEGRGQVHVYEQDVTGWTPSQILQPAELTPDAGFGEQLALEEYQVGSIVRHRLAVGAPGGGQVFIYAQTVSGLALEQVIEAPPGDASSGFGSAIALDQDLLVVGAPETDTVTGLAEAGRAYAYLDDGTGHFRLVKEIHSPSVVEGEHFGHAVAADQGRILISAPDGPNGGIVYPYHWDPSDWQVEYDFNALTASNSGRFGVSLAIDGSTDPNLAGPFAVVGDPEAPDGVGEAHVFEHSGLPGQRGVWSWSATLQPDFALPGDGVGTSVALAGGIALVGAPGADLASADAGRVFVFESVDSTWLERPPLEVATAAAGDQVSTVAFDGQSVWVGSPTDDVDATVDTGSIYSFQTPSPSPAATGGPITLEIETAVLDHGNPHFAVGGLLPGVDLAVNPNGGVTVNELAAGIQTLRVDPPPGWTLTAAGCDLPSAGANLEWRTASFTVTPGGGGTCTFQADQLNTLTGSDVAVDIATQEGEVNLVFESVSEDGLTTVETSSTGPEIPSGFSLGDPPVFFDISTTAEFSGGVEVCIDYSQMTFEDESRVWLYHYEDDLWVNITDFVDRVNDVICGVTSSFSPFALLAPPNEPPVADPAGPYLAGVSQSFTVDGTGSSDPDGDPMTFEWAFEGTNRSGASVDYTAPATAGIYPVTLTVDDGNGGVVTASTYVVVYDPSAGFVTGGGWINSPEGAYLPDPSLSGKATFGFVAKYKKGSSIPTGTSEFQFSAGDMNFRSSSYEWLVVTGGEAAKFKGVGAINGEGIYKFQIWASDNDQDSFRIRIWTEDAAGTETTIYDNGFDQHLSGGSIVIHTRATST